MSIDPLAEAMAGWSPYNYTFRNPISYSDPTGLMPETDCPDCAFEYDHPGVTVVAEKEPTLWDDLTRNRFDHWEPMGTGAGLSVNPNFPQYSQYAEDLKQVIWDGLSPVLLTVAGGGSYSVGGYNALKNSFQQQINWFRLRMAFRYSDEGFRALNAAKDSRLTAIGTYKAPQNKIEATLSKRSKLKIGEKSYRRGNDLPGSNATMYTSRSYPDYNSLSLGQSTGSYNTVRPSPMFYRELSLTQRIAIGGGGATLAIIYSYKRQQENIEKNAKE